MEFALAETRSGETNLKLILSCFQEWANRELLTRLTRERQLMQEGKLESFRSNVATSTGVIEMTAENDFWKAPFFYVEIKTKIDTDNDTRIDEEPEKERPRFRERIGRTSVASSITEEYQEMLDWDAHIETPPPPRWSGTIKVRFKYVGRSKPIPIDDPWA